MLFTFGREIYNPSKSLETGTCTFAALFPCLNLKDKSSSIKMVYFSISVGNDLSLEKSGYITAITYVLNLNIVLYIILYIFFAICTNMQSKTLKTRKTLLRIYLTKTIFYGFFPYHSNVNARNVHFIPVREIRFSIY